MKKLNQEQFKEYIKKNGLTKARLSLSYYHTPKETILWFGLHNESISTYNDDTENKNKEFGYDFFYERIFDSYGGVFIVDDEEMKIDIKEWIKSMMDKQDKRDWSTSMVDFIMAVEKANVPGWKREEFLDMWIKEKENRK